VTGHSLYTTPEFGLTSLTLNADIDCESGRICIRKLAFPRVTVLVIMPERCLIEIKFTYQRSDLADTLAWCDYLNFKVDENDNIRMLHQGNQITVDDAALLVMLPLKQPDFKPPESAQKM